MVLNQDLLAVALGKREEYERLQDDTERARAGFHRAVRHLHVDGAPLREIADALGLSHQRVHQIVGDADPVSADELDNAPDQLSCSFCGRVRKSCTKLIAGPGACICDRCVPTVDRVSSGGVHDELRLASDLGIKCQFCGKKARRVDWLVHSTEAKDASICNECLALIEEALSEDEGGANRPGPS